jgi:hypothetical protein
MRPFKALCLIFIHSIRPKLTERWVINGVINRAVRPSPTNVVIIVPLGGAVWNLKPKVFVQRSIQL